MTEMTEMTEDTGNLDFVVTKKKGIQQCKKEVHEKRQELDQQGYDCNIGPFYSTYDKKGENTGKQRLIGYTLYYSPRNSKMKKEMKGA